MRETIDVDFIQEIVMIRTVALFLAVCLSPTGLLAQSKPNIRNPAIDATNAGGALIARACMSNDPARKVQFLETFVMGHSNHEAIGYVYLQLQILYQDLHIHQILF